MNTTVVMLRAKLFVEIFISKPIKYFCVNLLFLKYLLSNTMSGTKLTTRYASQFQGRSPEKIRIT